jgi:uncharacterized protein (TIGR01777 family)
MIGRSVRARLTRFGHTVVPLVRRKPSAVEIGWDPEEGVLNAEQLGHVDAVINLAGESIAGKRWTIAQKQRIVTSRVRGTSLLAGVLAQLPVKPRVLISASAIGYYGDKGNQIMTESSPMGKGFLPDVCRQWEQATSAASDAGIRVVLLRFGIVLSAEGGALAKMLPPFRMGLGGVIGTGLQWMSWISLRDVDAIIADTLEDESFAGPINVVSPQAVTNAAFTSALGKVLGRPTLAPLPAGAARFIFGQMADEMLLASNRVEPAVLNDAGYNFLHPDINSALRAALKR